MSALNDPRVEPLLTMRVAGSACRMPRAMREERRALGCRCPIALVVPLVVRDRLVGVAASGGPDDARGFTEESLALAMGIAQSAAWRSSTPRCTPAPGAWGGRGAQRLAREVHDTLAQGLTAIALQLDTAERLLPPAPRRSGIVGRARAGAPLAGRGAPGGLGPDGSAARQRLVAGGDPGGGRAVRAADRACRPNFGRGDGAPLTDEQATAVLRVAQEALHNVEKHAEPTRVRVELQHDGGSGRLTLLVADDGKGFDRKTLAPRTAAASG